MMMNIVFIFFIACGAFADDHTHTYEDGDEVTFWFNKVGPYHNPQETYDYYDLPFCQPSGKELLTKSDSLGVVLEGNDLTDSGLLVKFKEPQTFTKICELTISEETSDEFTEAVQQHYWYQMYIDELPVWGMVGEYMVAEPRDGQGEVQEQGFIYTHKEFSISYNGDQIIEVNLTSENPRPLITGETHPLTFSVSWVETDKDFEHRFDRYLDFDFFEHQIHWFSIFNSFMMVVFLCGLVVLILMRTLRADYARYSKEEDDELEMDRVVDETGWKQVHGDVFRPPPYLLLYAALLGTGYQLFVLVLLVIVFVLIGEFYDERGTIVTAFLTFWCLTSFVAGYYGGGYYKRNQGVEWKECMLLTAALLPGLCFGVSFLLNFIAYYYDSTASLTITSMVMLICVWLFVSCPLVLLGTIVGRSTAVPGDFPCRVNSFKRPIPDGKWYTHPVAMSLFTGILPFGSIFIEMYFIFTSFWNYKFYYVYGFMFLVYLILFIVTLCVTIVSTYFLLNAEDHRWQWTAFMSGGSTSLYVFLYAIYYFFTKTRMSGALQTSYYFGYMFLFCSGLFILCGTIGFMGTNMFVRKIFQSIHSD